MTAETEKLIRAFKEISENHKANAKILDDISMDWENDSISLAFIRRQIAIETSNSVSMLNAALEIQKRTL